MGALTPALLALAAQLRGVPPAGGRLAEPAAVVPSEVPAGTVPATPAPDLAAIFAMPLDRFAREGQLIEVRIPWLDVTLWFVPEERDAEALGRERVSRGRIWTARELIALMALLDRAPEIVQRLALAKREFDGDIVEVRRR